MIIMTGEDVIKITVINVITMTIEVKDDPMIIMINVEDDHMITMTNVVKDVITMTNVEADHMTTMIKGDPTITMITKEDQMNIMTGVIIMILVIVSMANEVVVTMTTGVTAAMNRGHQRGRLTTKTHFGTIVGMHCKCRKRLKRWKNGVGIS